MLAESSVPGFSEWVAHYRRQNTTIFDSDPEFAEWFAKEYQPLAGGWQY